MTDSPMLKNLQALGDAARAAGTQKCYYYPGMKGDVLAGAIEKDLLPSLNERNAFEFGYGASLAGKRTAVIFKGVGLATCLDSVHHAVISGVGAGLVLVVLEDTVAASSPEIIDSRSLTDYLGTLVIEPATMEGATQSIHEAFAASEELDAPIIVRITFDLLNSAPSDAAVKSIAPAKHVDVRTYRRKFIGAWSERHKQHEQRLLAIQQYVDRFYKASTGKVDALVFGCSSGHEGLSVTHYPIAKSIRSLYRQQHPAVYEVGSNYALRSLRANEPFKVDNSPVLKGALLPSAEWELALKPINKGTYFAVVGDEGRYTFDTTEKIDVCLCMGSAINIAAGMSDASGKPALAVTGDFAYQFSAYQSILEARSRNVQLDILLLDDAKAVSTGGQRNVASLDTADVRHYLGDYQNCEYSKLSPDYIRENQGGINLYHVTKYEE